MRYCIILLLLAVVLMAAGCTTTQQPVATPEATMAPQTPTPEPTVTRPLQGMDPIIGSWENGLIFDADGYVGGNRNISWKANDMEKHSYFVTVESRAVKDIEAGRIIDPSALSTEWIYNPYSDAIHKRGSSQGFRRVVEGTVTPAPLGQ